MGILIIVKSVPVNTDVQVSLWYGNLEYIRYIPRWYIWSYGIVVLLLNDSLKNIPIDFHSGYTS